MPFKTLTSGLGLLFGEQRLLGLHGVDDGPKGELQRRAGNQVGDRGDDAMTLAESVT
jgi:hypothetical protein